MEPTLLQIIANPIANDVTITLLPTVSSMTFSDISALACAVVTRIPQQMG